MPEDTVDRSTKRPNVSEELDEQLADAVNPLVRIPSDRLNFGDRLEILLDEYRNQEAEIAQLEAEIDDLEDQLDAARSGGLVRG